MAPKPRHSPSDSEKSKTTKFELINLEGQVVHSGNSSSIATFLSTDKEAEGCIPGLSIVLSKGREVLYTLKGGTNEEREEVLNLVKKPAPDTISIPVVTLKNKD